MLRCRLLSRLFSMFLTFASLRLHPSIHTTYTGLASRSALSTIVGQSRGSSTPSLLPEFGPAVSSPTLDGGLVVVVILLGCYYWSGRASLDPSRRDGSHCHDAIGRQCGRLGVPRWNPVA
jgi:hypothetical protein